MSSQTHASVTAPQLRHHARRERLLANIGAVRGRLEDFATLPQLPEVPGALDDRCGAEVQGDDLLGHHAHHPVDPLETAPDQEGR